ncbi:unnamed protein product [Colias eurytheme]|nr:unnamed protein product [Colias eurytheme]
MDNVQLASSLQYIDVNNNEFYDKLQEEIDSDLARLKKNVTIITDLRLTAAEMEVETAALYHAELWYNIEELKLYSKQN